MSKSTNHNAPPMDDEAPTADERALDPLFEIARQWAPTSEQSQGMLRGIYRPGQTLRNRYVRWIAASLASAATIGAGAFVLFSPDQPRAWALADVARLMREAPIIKRISSDSIYYSGRGYSAFASTDGSRAWYYDFDEAEITDYERGRGDKGAIFINSTDPSDRAAFLADGPQTDLERFLDKAAQKGKAFEDVWRREDIVEAGKPMIKITHKDRQHTPVYEHVIDDRTGMLVRSKSWTDTIRYEYPDVGPRNIYDLGVPPDTKVIDSRATPELLDLRDRVVASMDIDYGPHVMMKIQSGRITQIDRYISDGVRYRTDEFPTCEFDISSPQKMALVAKQLIETDLAGTERTKRFFDGRVVTVLIRNEDGTPAHRYVSDRRWALSFIYSLRESAWLSKEGIFFSRGQWSAQWELLGPDEAGWEGIRILSQANHLDRPRLDEVWYDPFHGLLPASMRRLTFPDPDWQLNPDWHEEYINGSTSPIVRLLPEAPAQGTEREVLEWGELIPGTWYPKLILTRFIVQNDEGDWVEQEDSGFEDGRVTMGQVLRKRPEDRPANPETQPAWTYTYVLAIPLDHLEDEWFAVPDEWLDVPIKN